jgi:hypothetical protein
LAHEAIGQLSPASVQPPFFLSDHDMVGKREISSQGD